MTNNVSNEVIICMIKIAKTEVYENKNIAAYLTLSTLLEKMELCK